MSTWNWASFRGSREMLRYMKRDLNHLRGVVEQVPQRRVAVQAGGCLGLFPKFLAERFETVYTFEPDPENFLTLCQNAPAKNIVKFQAAIGCLHTGVAISHERWSEKPGTSHEGIRHVSGPGPIPTLLIDDLELPVCDLIYLDIEGHEIFALHGAVETIQRCKPVIALEINEMVTHVGKTESDVRAYIDVLGYRYAQQIGTSDHLFLPDAFFDEVRDDLEEVPC